MNKFEEIAAQTRIRRQLLANGYTPLANKDKMCVLEGWSHMAVDEAKIDEWSTQLKWRATGVRVERGLAVIDLDVNDANVVESIIDALPDDVWRVLRFAPIRVGKGAKEAWFVRLADGEDPFYRLASAGFREPDAGDDGTVHRVEIFAGEGGGRQFGAYGAHTIGDDGGIAVSYQWRGDAEVDARGLCDVPFDDLPRVTRAQLAIVADTATQVLDAMGWRRDIRSKPGFSSGAPLFDLLDDMEFETRDHGSADLAGLTELAQLYGDVRLSASWLEGEAAVNMTRCIASIHPGDGRVSVLETASFEIHRPKSMAPKPITLGAFERMQELAAQGGIFSAPSAVAPDVVAVSPSPSPSDIGAEMRGDMEQVVEALLRDVAFCPSEQRCVMPIDGTAERAMSLANFRVLLQPWSVEVRGPRGGKETINPASLWVSDPRRVVVGGHRFRPDVGDERLVAGEGGQQFINTYRAPDLPDAIPSMVSAARDAFEALLSHLLPNAIDRDWFRMWIAAKVQRPWVPNCGVIMVAEQQGTGRGTLFDMIGPALGRQYVRSISSTELMGGQGQGQYNEWLASSLLVLCEEVMAGDDAGGAMTWKRREVYERLKQLVDPRQRVMEIRRKGLQNYSAEVFASILMATNHMNALPLDRNDRRIAVLVQPEIRFEDVPSLRALVDPWRASGRFSDDFAAGLRQHLLDVDVDFDALRIAPELSGGRDMMRDENISDLDTILADVCDDIPGDFITNNDIQRRLQNALVALGEIDHIKNWWVRAQEALKRPNGFGWRRIRTRQVIRSVSGKGKQATVYYREAGGGPERWASASWDERAHLLSRGADINDKVNRVERAMHDKSTPSDRGDSGMVN